MVWFGSVWPRACSRIPSWAWALCDGTQTSPPPGLHTPKINGNALVTQYGAIRLRLAVALLQGGNELRFQAAPEWKHHAAQCAVPLPPGPVCDQCLCKAWNGEDALDQTAKSRPPPNAQPGAEASFEPSHLSRKTANQNPRADPEFSEDHAAADGARSYPPLSASDGRATSYCERGPLLKPSKRGSKQDSVGKRLLS